jgi:MFS family permease
VPRTPSLLVAHSAFHHALFPIPVITLFWKDEIGMSFTAIMVLQAIFSATIVLFEFPSGYVADRVGYRASLLIGASFWTMGYVVYAIGTTFAAITAAEILAGIGMSFTSGANSALLYVSVARGEYIRWEGRVRAAAQISEAASSSIGGWLYALAPRLPFWCQVPAAMANVATAYAMREPGVVPIGERVSHLRRALGIVRTSLWHHARLRATIAFSVVLGLASFFLVWLVQPYMQAHGVPTAWFGPIWATLHVFLAVVSMLSHRVAARWGTSATLFGCCALIALGYGGMALGSSVFSFLFYLCLMTVRGLQGPLLVQALQQDAPAEDRATVLSLNALMFRIAFTVLGPPVGLLVERAGMTTALATLGATLTVLALATFLAFHRAHGGNLRLERSEITRGETSP